MMQTICKVAGVSTKRVLPFPWWAIRATSSLMELSNEMLEMRCLWNEGLELGNTKFCERIGDEPKTPLDDAVRATLKGMKSIDTHLCGEISAESV